MVASPIKKVERLKDQGSSGSRSYEFCTKIARVKEIKTANASVFNISVGHWCNPPLGPPALTNFS